MASLNFYAGKDENRRSVPGRRERRIADSSSHAASVHFGRLGSIAGSASGSYDGVHMTIATTPSERLVADPDLVSVRGEDWFAGLLG